MSDKPSKSPMSGTIWSNYTERLGLYREISFARSELRDRRGTRTPYATIMMREGHAILSADRKFFEAARAAVLAEREAIAESLEQAGRSIEAALHITGRAINFLQDEWHLEHKVSLRAGGLNCETNLGPALIEPHGVKTARENSRGAKADRIREKLLGLHKTKRPIPGSRSTRFKHRLDGRFGGRGSWERRT